MLEAALERDVYGLSADGAAAARERVQDAGGAARRGAFRPYSGPAVGAAVGALRVPECLRGASRAAARCRVVPLRPSVRPVFPVPPGSVFFFVK